MLKSLVLFLLGAAISLVSFGQENENILRLNKGKVAFHSQAELEVIRAHTEEFKGVLDMSNNEFAISIPLSNFLGFNSPLQMEHFNENYLESDKFENATYAGKIKNEFDLHKDGRSIIMTHGILTIHGIKVERDIEVELVINRGIIGIKSEFKVPLKDHGIKIPNAVKGKIAEVIEVEFFALFE
jgi:polyisoprenoid-binding protein YceI